MEGAIAHSETGWSNDRLGYIWLTEVFDPYTKQHTKGTKRLLIMDGHRQRLFRAIRDLRKEKQHYPVTVLHIPLQYPEIY